MQYTAKRALSDLTLALIILRIVSYSLLLKGWSGWEHTWTPLSGTPSLQTGVPRSQRALFSARMHVSTPER